jgi:hypothetical protein
MGGQLWMMLLRPHNERFFLVYSALLLAMIIIMEFFAL